MLRQRRISSSNKLTNNKDKSKPIKEIVVSEEKKAKKLSYKEQSELEKLPAKIEQWEAEQKSLHAQMASSDFYQQDNELITKTQQQLAELEAALAKGYARWEELEG